MGVLSRKGKVTLLLGMLFVVFTLALASVIISSIPFPSSQHGEGYVDPASAIYINSSGDIIIPPFGSTDYEIERQGNTYILNGNVPNWLIIEKSNIVLDGRGFTLGSQDGLSLSSVVNVTVKDLNVKAHYLHVALQDAQNCTLLRTNSSYNIALSDSNNNLIHDCSGSIILERSSKNTVENCTTGPIELNKSDGNSILNNTCIYSGRSLSLADSSNNLLFGNRFSGMAWWISMYGSSHFNSIVGNEISMGSRYYADSLTADNYIYYNNFLNFAWNQSRTAPVNVWSSNMKGNYWADYHGTDANHDGVGDTPYIIDKTNQDNYPLMDPVNIADEPIPVR